MIRLKVVDGCLLASHRGVPWANSCANKQINRRNEHQKHGECFPEATRRVSVQRNQGHTIGTDIKIESNTKDIPLPRQWDFSKSRSITITLWQKEKKFDCMKTESVKYIVQRLTELVSRRFM